MFASLQRRWNQLRLSRRFGSIGRFGWVRLPAHRPETGPPLHPSLLWVGERDEERRRTGFGIDSDPLLADQKAAMEVLESEAIRRLPSPPQSRTGFACRESLALAERGAVIELMERDALLYHWLTGAPPVALTRAGAWWEATLACRASDVTVILRGQASRYGCWWLGLGAAEDPEAARRKAYLEAESAAWKHEWLGECPPVRAGDAIARHHHDTREPQIAERAAGLFRVAPSPPPRATRRLEEWLASATISARIPFPNESEPHAWVAQASHTQLLPLLFGESFRNHRGAYEKILGQPAREPWLPHPFD